MHQSQKAQYAALPYRRSNGSIEIMLITSRGSRRWIIPKGWPVPGMKPSEAAAHEAMEEGGVIGRVSESPRGQYCYQKRLSDGSCSPCIVDVFVLEVRSQLHHWPEKHQRSTKWVSAQDAASFVQEPGLSQIIDTLAGEILREQ
ncbi:MAG: NUDIX hydrolase [Pseudorhodoplanes sp.]|uniref:NUDIX hydrolase n=1 Tax=Pseudorhodoplanes sp. TaxID=1934341 RepID=UPI003D102DF6